MRFAIVVSHFNPEVTDGLLRGARAWLEEKRAPVADGDIIRAPGAFELPLIAQTLAKTGQYSGVICLGCVIKGDTAHFEYISLAASVGILNASLATEVPVTFGVLTTYTDEQAQVRSRDDAHNKGREAAQAAYESALGAIEDPEWLITLMGTITATITTMVMGTRMGTAT